MGPTIGYNDGDIYSVAGAIYECCPDVANSSRVGMNEVNYENIVCEDETDTKE